MSAHLHHQHDLEHVHYEPAVHDDYPRHHHEWAGNNHFVTVEYVDYVALDLHNAACHADDYDITVGADHDHPGYDIRWADLHSRTTPPADSDVP